MARSVTPDFAVLERRLLAALDQPHKIYHGEPYPFVAGAGGRGRAARSRPPRDRGVSERALSLLITDHGAERRDLQQRRSHVRSKTAAGGSHPLRTLDIGR